MFQTYYMVFSGYSCFLKNKSDRHDITPTYYICEQYFRIEIDHKFVTPVTLHLTFVYFMFLFRYNIRNSIIINCDDVSFIFHAIEYNKQTRTLEKEEYYAPQKV